MLVADFGLPMEQQSIGEIQGGVPWGVGTMASQSCNLKRCWVSMGESKERNEVWGQSFGEQQIKAKKESSLPYHQRGNQKPRMTQCHRTHLPSENHDII